MPKRDKRIARVLFWIALVMLALSCYEIGVRLDDIVGEFRMAAHMISDGKITVLEFLFKYMWDLNSVPAAGYMLLYALLAVWTLASRRTYRACAFLFLPAAALLALGFRLRPSLFGELIQTVKLVPLALLTALCLVHAFMRPRRCRPAPRPYWKEEDLIRRPKPRHRRAA